jgi:hypothetical protein
MQRLPLTQTSQRHKFLIADKDDYDATVCCVIHPAVDHLPSARKPSCMITKSLGPGRPWPLGKPRAVFQTEKALELSNIPCRHTLAHLFYLDVSRMQSSSSRWNSGSRRKKPACAIASDKSRQVRWLHSLLLGTLTLFRYSFLLYKRSACLPRLR